MGKDTLEMKRNLEDIGAKVSELMLMSWIAELEGSDIHSKLLQIHQTTCQLQQAFCNPAIVEGYRAAAVNQILRVGELIAEMDITPDHRQMLSIGMAAERAVEMIKEHQQIMRFSANVNQETDPETAVEEAA